MERIGDVERMSAFYEPGLELLTATKTMKPITSNAIIGQGRLKNSQLFMDSTFFPKKLSKMWFIKNPILAPICVDFLRLLFPYFSSKFGPT